MSSEDIDSLLDGLEDTETMAELQAHVIRANETLQEFQTAGTDPDGRPEIADSLEAWLGTLREQVERISGDAAEQYTITVSGGITGPSVSVGVTYSSD